MGKGSRNRINRDAEPQKPEKKKVRKYRKPMSPVLKRVIACAVCLLIVVAIVFGSLASNGTFKRANVLVRSQAGSYSINQQMATYILWEQMFSNYYNTYMQIFGSSLNSGSSGMTVESIMNTVLNTVRTSLSDELHTSLESASKVLTGYVAVCDAAKDMGITLTKAEAKEARANAKQSLKTMAGADTSEQVFLNYYVGNNVKVKDVLDAAEMQALYNKVITKKQDELKNILGADLDGVLTNKYINENPETFFSTDYLVKVTSDEALKTKLEGVSSAEEFKKALVNYALQSGGSGSYKALFDKYLVGDGTDENPNRATVADKALTAVEKKSDEPELQTALDEWNAAHTEDVFYSDSYTKATLDGMDTRLSDWLLAERNPLDTTVIYGTDAIYTVVFIKDITDSGEGAEKTVEAAILTLIMDTGETFASSDGSINDDAFRANVFEELYYAAEINEESDKKYTDSSVEKVKNFMEDLIKVATDAMDGIETKTETFAKEPEKDTYKDWMFDFNADTLERNGAQNGAVKSFENEEDNKDGKYSVYVIEKALKKNEDPVVRGGIGAFTTEAEAQAFLATLNGLTGDALKQAFVDNKSATYYDSISKESLKDMETLSEWVFASDRKANDISGVIAVTTKSGSTSTTAYYVAFFNSTLPTYQADAESGYVDEQTEDWIEKLTSDGGYVLTGMNRIKDKKKPKDTATA